jgi:hypothetical protein
VRLPKYDHVVKTFPSDRAHPTAEWIAQQITEAFPWHETPRYLIRDRDGIYGAAVNTPITSYGYPRQAYCPGNFAFRMIVSNPRDFAKGLRRLTRRHDPPHFTMATSVQDSSD